jgi:hypothetical protein
MDGMVGNVPIALAPAILLSLLGIGIDVAGLGKIAREMLHWTGGAISETGVVTVIGLVGACHLDPDQYNVED